MPRPVTFRPLTLWTWALLALTGIGIALTVLSAVATLSQIQSIEQLQEGRQSYKPKLEQARTILKLVCAGAFMVGSVIGWVYIAWLYLRFRNLLALEASPRFSPSRAVLLSIVPLLNLLMALPIILDLWHGSDPARIPGRLSTEPTRNRTVVLWFCCTLFNLVAAGVLVLMVSIAAPLQPATVIRLNYALLCLQPLAILQGIMFALVITKIADNQNARHEFVRRRGLSVAPNM